MACRKFIASSPQKKELRPLPPFHFHAGQLYAAGIRAFPQVALYHVGLGYCAAEGGRIEESVAHHRRAVELVPNSYLHLNDLGYSLEWSTNHAETTDEKCAAEESSTTSNMTAAETRVRSALQKRKKEELIETLIELASTDRAIMRHLEAKFNIEAPVHDVVIATKQAIADATDFDEAQINYNFDYDYEAYASVRKYFKKLVDALQFEEAMELSLELMRQGSYQVEMSDEGVMTEDIEECLHVIINALKKSDLTADQVTEWCDEMTKAVADASK